MIKVILLNIILVLLVTLLFSWLQLCLMNGLRENIEIDMLKNTKQVEELIYKSHEALNKIASHADICEKNENIQINLLKQIKIRQEDIFATIQNRKLGNLMSKRQELHSLSESIK